MMDTPGFLSPFNNPASLSWLMRAVPLRVRPVVTGSGDGPR